MEDLNTMSRTAIDLQHSFITYDSDLHAVDAPQSFAALSDESVRCVLGAVDFVDDESVHADQWECHPLGDETLCVLEGRLLVEINREDAIEAVPLVKGQALIVPRARWHRLRVLEPGRLLFFTPVAGTALSSVVARGENLDRETGARERSLA
jgi:mannose-6-phosphate isomerase-like protein (cupin superfamily)